MAWLLCVGGLGVPPGVLAAEPVEELDRLEQVARTHPDEAASELSAVLATWPAESVRTVEGLSLLGALHVRQDDGDAANRDMTRLDQLAHQGADAAVRSNAGVALACLRANLLTNGGPLTRADSLLEETLSTLDPGTSPRLRLDCLLAHARIKESLGQYEAALRMFQDAIRRVDQQGPPWQRAEQRVAAANVLRRAGQAQQASEVNDQALRLARDQADWLAQSKARTVDSMLPAGQSSDAAQLSALQDAIDFARRAGAQREQALGMANLSDYYLLRNESTKALMLAQQALPLARHSHSRSAEGVALVNAGLALIAMHRKEEGLRLSRESIDRDLRADDVVSATESLLDLGHYLEQAGYANEAVAAYQEHRRLADEVARRSQQRDVLELQEGFDAERRRHERDLLVEDNRLKEEQYRERALRYRFWIMAISASGLLLLLASLLYRRVRATQVALRHSTERLRAETWQDPLTGLANRRHFLALCNGPEATWPEACGALYLLDLDHFKQINDRQGHAAGDEVLMEVARRLRAVTRDEDLVVRWGGEEFLIVVPFGVLDQGEGLAQRLLNALAALPVVVGSKHIPVTGSIGYAVFPLQPHQVEVPWPVAIDLVDTAMYLAKTRGRNRACGARHLPARDVTELTRLMGDMESAWRDGRAFMAELHGLAPAEEAAA